MEPEPEPELNVDLLKKNFICIIPMDQHVTLERLGNNKGCCIGYALYWQCHFLKKSRKAKQNFRKTLQGPVCKDVVKLQRNHSKSRGKKLRRINIKDMILKYLFEEKTGPSIMTNISFFGKGDGHTIMMYFDNNNYFHFFDANIGWFKSNICNVSKEIIKDFIYNIWTLLEYNEMRTTKYYIKQYTHNPGSKIAP